MFRWKMFFLQLKRNNLNKHLKSILLNSTTLTVGRLQVKNNKNMCIELKELHSLDEGMRAFGKSNRMDLLAIKLSMSATVLRNKLNPDREFHKLSLMETVLLTIHTGDFSLFRSSLNMLGHDVHKVSAESCESKMLHLVLQSCRKAGNISNIYEKASEDMVIDETERAVLLQA